MAGAWSRLHAGEAQAGSAKGARGIAERLLEREVAVKVLLED